MAGRPEGAVCIQNLWEYKVRIWLVEVFSKNARHNLVGQKILMSKITAEASGTTWVGVKCVNI